MRTIYILLISIIVIYLIYQVCQKYITQENFDPSLVPVSSIISLANMAQKLVTGSGTFTFPNNFSIGSTTTAPHDLIVTSYASIGGNTSIGGNMIVGDNTTIKGNSTITQSVTVPKIVGKNGSLNINSNLTLQNNLTVTNNLTVKKAMTLDNKLNVTKNFNGDTITINGLNNIFVFNNITSQLPATVNVKGNINVDSLNATSGTFNNVNANFLNTTVNFLNLTAPTVFKYLALISSMNAGYVANDGSTKKIFDTIGNSRYNIFTPPPPPITTPPTPQAVNAFKFVNLSVPSILSAPAVAAIYTNGALAVSSIDTYNLNANRISVQNGSDGGYNTLTIASTAADKADIHCDNLTIADASYGSTAKVNINGPLTVTGTFKATGTLKFKKSDGTIYDLLPVGSIMMWWNTSNIDIPTGWALLGGSVGAYIVAGDGSVGVGSNPALGDTFKNQVECKEWCWGPNCDWGHYWTGCCPSNVDMPTTKVNFIIRTS